MSGDKRYAFWRTGPRDAIAPDECKIGSAVA